MNIAIIHTPLDYSTGGERQMLNLSLELQKRGHSIEIFTNRLNKDRCFPELTGSLKINIVSPKNHLYKISKFSKKHSLWDSLGRIDILSIGQAIPNNKFDLINCHNLSSSWAASIAKKRLNIPAVWMCNEPPFWYFQKEIRKSKFIEPLFYNLYDKSTVKDINEIIVLSNKMKSLVKNIYKRRAIVIRSGVDIHERDENNIKILKNKYHLNSSFNILFIGSNNHYKRPKDCIMALKLLVDKYPKIKLIMVGVGIKNLNNFVDKLKLSRNILLLENIEDQDIISFHQISNIFLFPANQSWGLVVTEAMVAGKPVIVSNECGVSEIIDHNKTGFIFQHKNYQEIAKYIEVLINNPKLKEKIGLNAYNYIKENFSWEKYADEMEKVFKQKIL